MDNSFFNPMTNNKIKIIADDKIPFLKGVLEPFVDIEYYPGLDITKDKCIDADALLEYAPLHYPLPTLLFDRILEIGKFEREHVLCIINDKPKAQS